MDLNSYPKIYNLGHPEIADLFSVPVYAEEKVDGSQFSFGIDESGNLKTRSKGVRFEPEAAESIFAGAVATAIELVPQLQHGFVYRAEALQKPKHNTLTYGRTPHGNLILFDIMRQSAEDYMTREEKEFEADRLGLEIVPAISYELSDIAGLRAMLDTESVLGGCNVEGVVIKQQTQVLFGRDGKPKMGKYVSEVFKESNRTTGAWKEGRDTLADLVQTLATRYNTEARWRKSVERRRDDGNLLRAPQDIGPLLLDIQSDILSECEAEIKQILFDAVKKRVARGATGGFPEWYKMLLAKAQFSDEDAL